MSRIYLLQFNADTTILNQDPVEIQGGANGSPTLRIEAPFSSDNFVCKIDFVRADGFVVDRKTASFKSTVPVDVNGDEQTFFRYEYNFGSDVTKVDTGVAESILNGTVRFLNTVDTSLDETMTNAEFTVNQNVDGSDIVIPANDVNRLDDLIDDLQADKRDRNPTALTSKADIKDEDIITFHSSEDAAERKATAVDFKNYIDEDVISKIAFATTTDSTIDDPVAGYANFSVVVDSTTNDDYTNPLEELPFTTTLTDTFEEITSGIYPVGFFKLNEVTNLQFQNSFSLKTTGTTSTLRVEFYKIDNPDDLTGTLLGFSDITFSSPTFTLQSKTGVLVGPISINPDDGETFAFRALGKSDNIGDVITDEIGGLPNPKTFTTWGIPSSAFGETKMNVLISAVGARVVESQTDNNVMETTIDIVDLARLSQEQSFAEKNTFEKDVDILNDLLVSGTTTLEDLIVNGTQTILNTTTLEVEDNITLIAKGQTTGILDAGFETDRGSDENAQIIWQESSDKYVCGLLSDLKEIARVQDSPTANIAVYNTSSQLFETQTPTQVKTLLSLQNVDNTSDANKEVSIATQAEIDNLENTKLSEIAVENDDISVGAGTILNATGNTSFSIDGGNPNQINVFTPVGGTGTGIQPRGEATIFGDDGINPATDTVGDPGFPNPLSITPILTEIPILFSVLKQSNDLNVMTINATTNALDVDFVQNEGNQLEYKTTLKVIFENTAGTNVDVDFITKVDTVEVDRQPIRVPSTNAPNDGVETTYPFSVFETTLSVQQNATYFIEAPIATGVSVVSGTMEFKFQGVIGENVQDRMFKSQFATNGTTNKVDRSVATDAVFQHTATNPQDADIVLNLTGTILLVDGCVFSIKTPVMTSTANARISLDNENIFDIVFDVNGNQVIGTDVSDVEYDYKFDGTDFRLIRNTKATFRDEIKTGFVNHATITPIENSSPQYALKGNTVVTTTIDSVDKDLSIKSIGTNLFDKSIATLGFLINGTTGDLIVRAEGYASDFIKITSSTQYNFNDYLRVGGGTNSSIGFYDSSEVFISSFTTGASGNITITTPSNAVFLRLSGLTANIDIGQLELGAVATTFKDFIPRTTKFNLLDDLRSIDDGTGIVEDEAENGIVTRKVGTESILNGVTINTTNFPLMKSGSTYRIALDGGGVQTGTEGIDTANDDGTIEYALYVVTATETHIETGSSIAQKGSLYEVIDTTIAPTDHTITFATTQDAKIDQNKIEIDENSTQADSNTERIGNLETQKIESFTILNEEILVGNWSVSAIVGGNFDGFFSNVIDASGNSAGKKLVATDVATVSSVTSSFDDFTNAIFGPENETGIDTLTVYARIKPIVGIFINYQVDRGVF